MAVDLSNFDPQVVVAACAGLQVPDPQHPLGRGGQKAVWFSRYNGRDYVLKVIAADPDSTERAKRELELMRVCVSPRLASVGPLQLTSLDLGNNDEILYFLEEFIPGSPLNVVAKPFLSPAIIELGLHVGEAIGVLWDKGYIHRDVKPHNVMQKINGGGYVLLDAGMALDFAASSITQTGNVVGTIPYLSPEQLQMNKRDLDFRADMFALGVTMYECATGAHPFWNDQVPRGDVRWNIVNVPAPRPTVFNAALSDDLSDVILRVLEKQRHLRYAKLEHFMEDLGRLTF